MAEGDVNEDLLDYEEEEQTEVVGAAADAAKENGVKGKKDGVKGNYVSIHSSGFRDFLLKPEILRAIVDCGFEHPSEVQHECIPQVILAEIRRYEINVMEIEVRFSFSVPEPAVVNLLRSPGAIPKVNLAEVGTRLTRWEVRLSFFGSRARICKPFKEPRNDSQGKSRGSRYEINAMVTKVRFRFSIPESVLVNLL
jgi:hypothetical protein